MKQVGWEGPKDCKEGRHILKKTSVRTTPSACIAGWYCSIDLSLDLSLILYLVGPYRAGVDAVSLFHDLSER